MKKLYYLFLLFLGASGKQVDKSHEATQPEILTQETAGNVTGHADSEIGKILACMKNNFKDSDFSIWKVSEETGYQNRKISRLIKENYDLSFAQLLNDMRITEARALLARTGFTATEIAFKIGYNNYTHFIREFKKQTGVAAQKYRVRNTGGK